MVEIFNGWLIAEDFAKQSNLQSDTVVLTWTPILSRWQGLLIFLRGARRAKLNIATIKVVAWREGEARVRICQQHEAETTEQELGDSIARGRTTPIEATCPHGDSWDDCPDCSH